MSPAESPIAAIPAWAEQFAERLDAQRERLRRLVDAQRERSHAWESTLQAKLADLEQAVAETLDSHTPEGHDHRESQARTAEHHMHLAEEFAQQQSDLADHRAELESLRQSLEETHAQQVARQQALIDELARQVVELRDRDLAAHDRDEELRQREKDLHTREADLHQRELQIRENEGRLAKERTAVAHAQAEVDAVSRACDDAQQRVAAADFSLARRETFLERRTKALTDREEALTRRQDSFDLREAALLEREAALRQREEILEQRNEAFRQRSEAAQQAERTVHQQAAELAQELEEVKLREQRTRSQRTAIAHELRARRKELLAEAERQRAEAMQATAGDESALALQLAEAKVELSRLRAQEESQLTHYMLLEEKFEQAKRELLDLHEKLLAAEKRAEEALRAPSHSVVAGDELAELQRQLEEALTELRLTREENEELRERVAAKAGSSVAAAPGPVSMDWESQKQALLAQLESDFSESNPGDRSSKLTVEVAIRRTDEIVAAKENEIEELRRLLAQQSGSIGDVAIGAAAVAEVLDSDDLIRQERASLRELQEKLRDQLRQAEIDLSVERAKIARERVVLEEKMRQYEDQKQNGAGAVGDATDKKKTSNRGRWLERLGLRDQSSQ